MSFTSLRYDANVIASRDKQNQRAYDYVMNPPMQNPCFANGINVSGNIQKNIDLESQIRGLGSNLTRDVVREWSSPGTDLKQFRECEYLLPKSDRVRGSLVSDIQIKRFDVLPYDPTILAQYRRPYIGLNTRKFVKENLR